MRKRKPGTGYWQQHEQRRWSRRRRMGALAPFLVVGLLVGAVVGNALFDRDSQRLGPSQLAELWEKYKPGLSSGTSNSTAAKRWEDHYRQAPGGERPGHDARTPNRQEAAAGRAVRFAVCSSSVRVSCVVDGDTIWYRGEKIRIADINTPEISSPKCPYEEALGHKAKLRLVDLLNAGPFEVVRNGDRNRDRYGRLLRVIMRDGQSLGMVLVDEGLAHAWDGAKHPWC